MNTNTKTILWSVLASALLLGGLVLASSGSKGDEAVVTGGASLTALEESYDFGTVSMAKGEVSHEFKIKNNSAEPITVTKVYTSCMCTKASIVAASGKAGPFGMAGHGYIPSINVVVAPGEEAAIIAIFDPAAHGPAGVGPVAREITVEEKGVAPLTLGFRATVAP